MRHQHIHLNNRFQTALLLLFGLFVCLNAVANPGLNGRVVAIADGDTLTLLTSDNKQLRIRLAEIDAPESKQDYGNRAKQALSELVFNKNVSVVVQDIDRYGRSIGRIYVQDGSSTIDVNAELVRQGLAWVYRHYAKDEQLFEMEAQAREQKLGLWSLPADKQIPPWEWRRGQRNASTAKPALNTTAENFSCTVKKTCSQIQSCEEAMFYFKQCQQLALDGNKNGRPCENVCRDNLSALPLFGF